MRVAVFALPRRNGGGGKVIASSVARPTMLLCREERPMNTATTCPDDDDGDGALSLPTQWKKEEGGKRKRKRPFFPSAPPPFFLLRLQTIFPWTPRPPTKEGKNKIRSWPRKRKNTFLLLPMRIKSSPCHFLLPLLHVCPVVVAITFVAFPLQHPS